MTGDWVVSYREPFTDAQTELRFVRPSYFAFTSSDEVTQQQLDSGRRAAVCSDRRRIQIRGRVQ
jgi:hypothetical protein